MTKDNRLRCGHCGICYEGNATADETRTITCENCGTSTKLFEEDPDGLFSGALPPLPRLLAIGGALFFCLIAVRFTFVAIIPFVILMYLAFEVFQGHKKQRADRIVLWDRLRDAYNRLSKSNGALNDELNQTRASLNTELAQAKEALADLSARYEQIAPERRDMLAKEIRSQQEMLCMFGNIAAMTEHQEKLHASIQQLKMRIGSLEDEDLLQSFGFYKPLYDCADSDTYRQKLDDLRESQKKMVKSGTALKIDGVFMVGDNKVDGRKLAKNLEKVILRAFNGDCDSIIDKVTFSNIEAVESRIVKSYETLNELCDSAGLAISRAYRNAKLEELHLCYEYQVKRKEENEELRRQREEARESARVAKEIEEAERKIEKEENHFHRIMDELRVRMEASSLAERSQYEAKLREYEEKLAAVQKDKEEVEYRKQSTRAGYVYIISNIGSFGEDVYKIGVTRRLDPQERIDELGDASVPFRFDVHAMIFSHDAPMLEGALHEHFSDRTMNKINPRKEFFRVRLDEVEDVVRKHHNALVEFRKVAPAEDHRRSLAMGRSVGPAVASQL